MKFPGRRAAPRGRGPRRALPFGAFAVLWLRILVRVVHDVVGGTAYAVASARAGSICKGFGSQPAKRFSALIGERGREGIMALYLREKVLKAIRGARSRRQAAARFHRRDGHPHEHGAALRMGAAVGELDLTPCAKNGSICQFCLALLRKQPLPHRECNGMGDGRSAEILSRVIEMKSHSASGYA